MYEGPLEVKTKIPTLVLHYHYKYGHTFAKWIRELAILSGHSTQTYL
jgi:hypothetical protein